MPGSNPRTCSPRVLRVECMSLDCGGAAIVVELEHAPGRAWMKSLKRALLADEALEGAQAKFDGRFVYVVGVEGGPHRAQHRVVQALVAAEDKGEQGGAVRPPLDLAAPSSMSV